MISNNKDISKKSDLFDPEHPKNVLARHSIIKSFLANICKNLEATREFKNVQKIKLLFNTLEESLKTADIDEVINDKGQTKLIYTITMYTELINARCLTKFEEEAIISLIKFLMDLGADPNYLDYNGNHAKDHASFANSESVCTLLNSHDEKFKLNKTIKSKLETLRENILAHLKNPIQDQQIQALLTMSAKQIGRVKLEQHDASLLLHLYLVTNTIYKSAKTNTALDIEQLISLREKMICDDKKDYCFSASLTNQLCCQIAEVIDPETPINILYHQTLTENRKMPWEDPLEYTNELPEWPGDFYRTANNHIIKYTDVVHRAIIALTEQNHTKTANIWQCTDMEAADRPLSNHDLNILKTRSPTLCRLIEYTERIENYVKENQANINDGIYERLRRLREGLKKGEAKHDNEDTNPNSRLTIEGRIKGQELELGEDGFTAVADFNEWWHAIKKTPNGEVLHESVKAIDNNKLGIVLDIILDNDPHENRGAAFYCMRLKGRDLGEVIDKESVKQQLLQLDGTIDFRENPQTILAWEKEILNEIDQSFQEIDHSHDLLAALLKFPDFLELCFKEDLDLISLINVFKNPSKNFLTYFNKLLLNCIDTSDASFAKALLNLNIGFSKSCYIEAIHKAAGSHFTDERLLHNLIEKGGKYINAKLWETIFIDALKNNRFASMHIVLSCARDHLKLDLLNYVLHLLLQQNHSETDEQLQKIRLGLVKLIIKLQPETTLQTHQKKYQDNQLGKIADFSLFNFNNIDDELVKLYYQHASEKRELGTILRSAVYAGKERFAKAMLQYYNQHLIPYLEATLEIAAKQLLGEMLHHILKTQKQHLSPLILGKYYSLLLHINLDLLIELIQDPEFNFDCKDDEGYLIHHVVKADLNLLDTICIKAPKTALALNKENQTPLELAAQLNKPNIVRTLLTNFYASYSPEQLRETLIQLILNNQSELAITLIKLRPDVRLDCPPLPGKTDQPISVFHTAIKKQFDIEFIKLLLQNPKTYQLSTKSEHDLISYCSQYHEKALELLLTDYWPNFSNEVLTAAFSMLIRKNKFDSAAILMAQGIALQFEKIASSDLMLFLSSSHCTEEMFQLTFNKLDHNIPATLKLAVDTNNVKLVNYLLQNHIDSITLADLNQAVDTAAIKNKEEVICLLKFSYSKNIPASCWLSAFDKLVQLKRLPEATDLLTRLRTFYPNLLESWHLKNPKMLHNILDVCSFHDSKHWELIDYFCNHKDVFHIKNDNDNTILNIMLKECHESSPMSQFRAFFHRYSHWLTTDDVCKTLKKFIKHKAYDLVELIIRLRDDVIQSQHDAKILIRFFEKHNTSASYDSTISNLKTKKKNLPKESSHANGSIDSHTSFFRKVKKKITEVKKGRPQQHTTLEKK